jgi:hypothetical protein
MTKPPIPYRITIKSEDGNDEVKDFFSTKDAANYLKISEQYVRDLSRGRGGEEMLKKYHIQRMKVAYTPYLIPIEPKYIKRSEL